MINLLTLLILCQKALLVLQLLGKTCAYKNDLFQFHRIAQAGVTLVLKSKTKKKQNKETTECECA